MRLARLLTALVLLLGSLLPSTAPAHELQPGYLEISHMGGDLWRVFWRKPDVRGAPMAIDARLPEACVQPTGPSVTFANGAWVTAWTTRCSPGLAGGKIQIDGLETTRTDVLVRFEPRDQSVQTHRLTSDDTSFQVSEVPNGWDVIRSYLPLGIDHILEGIDHLLFVFALLLLIPDRWKLIGTITAFTVAHSITMAAATFGWVNLPGPPVEAVIALSILFLASELLQRKDGQLRLSERYPWTVSFSFGLLHGFGFAGALEEIGLPQTEVPLALLSFNLGVEIGQLIFVAVVLVSGFLVSRIVPALTIGLRRPGSPLAVISAYVVGGIAAFWFIERVLGFWT
ncbi:MAG: HupE/UreJ family protein [Rhodobacteraceae bacterium]|nr:HupE/UreJ family protein [Paracoccaceae bacterium]